MTRCKVRFTAPDGLPRNPELGITWHSRTFPSTADAEAHATKECARWLSKRVTVTWELVTARPHPHHAISSGEISRGT